MYSFSLWTGREKKEKPNNSPNTFQQFFFLPFIIFVLALLTLFFFQIKTSCQVFESLRLLSLTWIILRPIKRKTITTASLHFPKWQVMVLCCFMVYVMNIYAYFSFKTVSLENMFSKSIMLTMNLCQYFN